MPRRGWMGVSPSSPARPRQEGLSRNTQRKSETLRKHERVRKRVSVTRDVGKACQCKKKSVEMLETEMLTAGALPVGEV